jgi:LmbE family N-acetylglucosaminyl deacetylase
VAHPDDETLALGPLLPSLARAVFVYATDGAPRDPADARAAGFADRATYAAARRAELEQMFRLAGIHPRQARYCGLTDREAVHALVWLARSLERVLAETRAELVLTHPYEGGHPDHDATAFAAHAACRRLAEEHHAAPALVEAPGYHWRDGRMLRGEFLPGAAAGGTTRRLEPSERALKQRLLACFPSQESTLRPFPVDRLSFRPAPAYDFTRPPHAGPLLYERFGWGMTGRRWRRHARAALASLGLVPARAAQEHGGAT